MSYIKSTSAAFKSFNTKGHDTPRSPVTNIIGNCSFGPYAIPLLLTTREPTMWVTGLLGYLPVRMFRYLSKAQLCRRGRLQTSGRGLYIHIYIYIYKQEVMHIHMSRSSRYPHREYLHQSRMFIPNAVGTEAPNILIPDTKGMRVYTLEICRFPNFKKRFQPT